jgi:hypothetical protein
MRPGQLPVAPLTNLFLAFVNFDDSFELQDQLGDVVSEASFLKLKHPALKINIAVGGWEFSSPPTANLFSRSTRFGHLNLHLGISTNHQYSGCQSS